MKWKVITIVNEKCRWNVYSIPIKHEIRRNELGHKPLRIIQCCLLYFHTSVKNNRQIAVIAWKPSKIFLWWMSNQSGNNFKQYRKLTKGVHIIYIYYREIAKVKLSNLKTISYSLYNFWCTLLYRHWIIYMF